MALGAGAGDVRNVMLRQGMRPAATGLALGTASTVVRDAREQSDVIASVVIIQSAAAALACFAPARRATRVDPATALRYE